MDKKSNKLITRRNLIIGGVATMVVLPSKWTKPVVDTIITPAHAQASAPATTVGTTTTLGTTTTSGTTTTTTTGGPPLPPTFD